MIKIYIYPENLKSKATLFLWELKDIGIISIIAIYILVKTGIIVPIALVLTYSFLTIKYEETSILDFLKYAGSFFIKQQVYEWSEESIEK